MEKEFKDLLIEFDEMGYEPTTLCENPQREIETFRNRLKQALTELKQIKEAKPNEAMDELNEIIDYITEDKKVKYKATILFDCEIIKNTLLKAQEQKKVLDILFGTKNIKVGFYDNANGRTYYIEFDRTRTQKIKQEEFELLKRWCEKCQK